MSEQKIRVMIVDDHDLVRDGLRMLLSSFDDIEVVADAAHGARGVELCTQFCPDVVLMDMVMPVMDGVTATRHIHDLCPAAQIIALTSFNDEDNVQRALKAGAISYMLKNVTIDELVSAVRKAYAGQSVLAPEAARVLISATTRPPIIGYDLSEREREVLSLLVRGLSNREIGDILHISASTVKNHVSTILSKLGTTSRTQAAALAVEHRLMHDTHV